VTNVAGTAKAPLAGQSSLFDPLRRLVTVTEIDLRLFGMLVALAVILFGFDFLSGGKFFRPVNMVTLAVQATTVGILSTGMVLVIVSRNIDLSVGSLTGFIAMTYALLMTDILPNVLGMGPDFPFRWAIALALGVGVGAAFGALQGFIIAYIGVPSFVVTLGGLLSIRGAVWYLSNGAAITGLDPSFNLLGGGVRGSVGGDLTWLVGAIGCVGVVYILISGRRQRQRYGFPVRPMWAEGSLAVLGCAAILGVCAFANNNFLPPSLATQYAQDHGIVEPPGGLHVPVGLPYPIIILIGVTLLVTWIANRRRFGRYVYAYGGNPDAAELAGINTRWTIMKTFIVMGILAALAYGLSFLGVNSPGQNVVAGIVLILAVAFDSWNRRRGS
jgi:D-xylose transport system permease protein